jgi:hypothetical protein
MKKILVNVFVPLIDDSFDIKLPINLEMNDVMSLIQDAIVDLSDKSYVVNPNAVLYDKNTGLLINTNNIVKFSGLKNGSSVMLI